MTALLLLLLSACSGPAHEVRGTTPVDLILPALDGGEVDFARYRGKYVVVHCFATGSVPAQVDVDQLSAAQDAYGDAIQVVGVAFDPDGYPLVAPWRRALGVRYLVALATPELAAGETALGRVAAVPTTLVLDRSGLVIARRDRALAPGELARILAQEIGPPPVR